jgi:hypothetical protein
VQYQPGEVGVDGGARVGGGPASVFKNSSRLSWKGLSGQARFRFPINPYYITLTTRGRCYAHNFLRFLPIFGEKNGVFLKIQCYDQLFSKFSLVLSQKTPIFRKFFWRK